MNDKINGTYKYSPDHSKFYTKELLLTNVLKMASQATQDAQHESFRHYLPDLNTPRFQAIAENDAYGHAQELLEHHRPPWLYGLYVHWRKLFEEPFKGVTSDGMYFLLLSILVSLNISN